MKKLLPFISTLLVVLSVGCSYDDSELTNRIDQLEEDQKLLEQQLADVQTLLEAYANRLTITSIEESAEGYVIRFSDNSTINILHGKDGQNGKDGKDGEDGKDGADGENGKNGEDGKDGADGETLIESIIIGTEDVTFVLTSGQTVIIPLDGYYDHQEAPIDFLDNDTKVLCVLAWDTNGDQQLSYKEAAAVTDIGTIFSGHDIKAFREFKYFTSVTAIPDVAFYGCNLLIAITLPQGIKSIGSEAFRNCSALTEINLPEGLESLGERCFQNCTALTSIEVPSTVAELPTYLFYSCEKLTDVVLHEGLQIVGERVFQSCDALKNITFPNGVLEIGTYAFYFCKALESVALPTGVTTIANSTFYNCESLKSIELPAGVVSVEDYAFRNCTALAIVALPETIESVGNYAFKNCSSLTTITLPKSVKEIGGWAFEDCSRLVSVWCHAVEPPTLGPDGFDYNGTNRIIYVPKESVEAYMAAPVWSDYKLAIEGYEFS